MYLFRRSCTLGHVVLSSILKNICKIIWIFLNIWEWNFKENSNYSYKVGNTSVMMSVIPSLHPNFLCTRLSKKYLTYNDETLHMDTHLGGDKVIRFWASGGAAFNSKMAAKIFHCSYLADYLSYRLEIWYRCSLYDKDKISKFWTPGALSSIPTWPPKYFIFHISETIWATDFKFVIEKKKTNILIFHNNAQLWVCFWGDGVDWLFCFAGFVQLKLGFVGKKSFPNCFLFRCFCFTIHQ